MVYLQFTIQKSNVSHTLTISYDLVSSKPTRSTSWSIDYDDTILQALHLGNGAILCHLKKGQKLVLLNTFSGHFSLASTGTTYLPCGSSRCGQTPIQLDYLSSYSEIKGQRVFLYGVDGSKKPITLHYNRKYTSRLVRSCCLSNWAHAMRKVVNKL